MQWLDRAVDYDPASAEALVHRAQYFMEVAQDPNTSETETQRLLALARVDLETASKSDIDNPTVGAMLAEQWLAFQEYERAGD